MSPGTRGDDAGSECNAIHIPRNTLVYGKSGRGSIGGSVRRFEGPRGQICPVPGAEWPGSAFSAFRKCFVFLGHVRAQQPKCFLFNKTGEGGGGRRGRKEHGRRKVRCFGGAACVHGSSSVRTIVRRLRIIICKPLWWGRRRLRPRGLLWTGLSWGARTVTGVTARGAGWSEHFWRHRGMAMTILMMVLLAVIVLGAIGLLLALTGFPEHPLHLRAARRNAAPLLTSWRGHRWDFRRRRLP